MTWPDGYETPAKVFKEFPSLSMGGATSVAIFPLYRGQRSTLICDELVACRHPARPRQARLRGRLVERCGRVWGGGRQWVADVRVWF